MSFGTLLYNIFEYLDYLRKFVIIWESMDSKQKAKYNQDTSGYTLLQKLGTPSGLISSIIGLLIIGASAGAWFNNIIKNTEILNFTTKNAIEKIHKEQEISELKDKLRNLKDSVLHYKYIKNEQKEGE